MLQLDFLPIFGFGHRLVVVQHTEKIYQGLPNLLRTSVFFAGVGPANVYHFVSDLNFVHTRQSDPFGLGVLAVFEAGPDFLGPEPSIRFVMSRLLVGGFLLCQKR